MVVSATSAEAIRNYTGPSLFERGFRPFFLGAGMFAAIAIPAWIYLLATGTSPNAHYSAFELHVHEMVFGYPSAVMAGFLLTATPNWTGRLPVTGAPLACLFLLWLAGRVALALPLTSTYPAFIVDASFLAALAGLLWREILAARNLRNIPVCLIVSLLAASNIAFHLLTIGGADTGITVRAALGLVALLLMLIGGRIVPSFTRNWLARMSGTHMPASFSNFDRIALFSGGIAIVCWITSPESLVTGAFTLAASAIHFLRLARWRGWSTVSEPLVVILHIGYLWLPIWLLLVSASTLDAGIIGPSASLHALTAGAIGTMTVAVMSRAILGHSGRQLSAGIGTTAIYTMIAGGALLRISAGFIPIDFVLLMAVSGGLWSAGFLLFVLIYGPMCLQRRHRA